MRAGDWQFEAPWLQGMPMHTEAALGAAIWLWMHDLRRRQEVLGNLEHRLLAPIEAGQYALARRRTPPSGMDAPSSPVALLLFARFDESAESRYLKAPSQKIAIRDWQSGDRLWLIDWTAPFGHTACLRRPVMALLAGYGARSLGRPGRGDSNRVRLWQSPLSPCATLLRERSERKEPAHW